MFIRFRIHVDVFCVNNAEYQHQHQHRRRQRQQHSSQLHGLAHYATQLLARTVTWLHRRVPTHSALIGTRRIIRAALESAWLGRARVRTGLRTASFYPIWLIIIIIIIIIIISIVIITITIVIIIIIIILVRCLLLHPDAGASNSRRGLLSLR